MAKKERNKLKKTRVNGLLSVSALTLISFYSPEVNVSVATHNGLNDTEVSSKLLASETSDMSQDSSDQGSHGGMMHDESGELPEGLESAENQLFEVGEMVTIQHVHMAGMEGAIAKVVGAFDTTAYEVTYQPTNGGEVVDNHRWVIQEEITEAKDQVEPLEIGSEVTLEAKHM